MKRIDEVLSCLIHCMQPPILRGCIETNCTNLFVSCGGYGVARNEIGGDQLTIDQAGHAFCREVVRHHFGCEWLGQDSVSTTSEELRSATSLEVLGDAFVVEVLRRFHNAGSYMQVDQ